MKKITPISTNTTSTTSPSVSDEEEAVQALMSLHNVSVTSGPSESENVKLGANLTLKGNQKQKVSYKVSHY